MQTSATDRADSFAMGRARIATILAVLILSSQVGSWRADDMSSGGPHQGVHIVALIVWVGMLLAFVLLGGGLFLNARTRALVNDETTLDHCRRAMALGFVAAIVAGAAVYLLSLIEPVSAQSGARLVLSAAIVLALLRFGTLERRAFGNG